MVSIQRSPAVGGSCVGEFLQSMSFVERKPHKYLGGLQITFALDCTHLTPSRTKVHCTVPAAPIRKHHAPKLTASLLAEAITSNTAVCRKSVQSALMCA